MQWAIAVYYKMPINLLRIIFDSVSPQKMWHRRDSNPCAFSVKEFSLTGKAHCDGEQKSSTLSTTPLCGRQMGENLNKKEND